MLYLNAYMVGRVYGGPEEGGWWYDCGEPLASIPIPSDYKPGKTYYLDSDGMPHIRDCNSCQGTGECEEEDPHGHPFMARCQDCGDIPEDCLVVCETLKKYRDMLAGEVSPRHQESLVMALQRHMAAPYPESRPHYE